MSVGKIILRVLLSLILLCIGGFLIYLGIYYNNLSKPNTIFSNMIDNISNTFKEYTKVNSNYYLGDNFTINGTGSFTLGSEKYTSGSEYNIINNLNKSKLDYSISQDKKNKKLLLVINDSNIINYKYLVDDSTEYYFVNEILSNYINGGTSNYFESLTGNNTTKGNINYLYNFIINSLKSNLNDSYFRKYSVNTSINGKDTPVYQISLTLDNKTIINILNSILKDLKKDEESYKILSSINNNFNKVKVKSNIKYLKDNENYTINIYTNKSLYKPLKYEIVHIDNDDKKSYTYVGDIKKGLLSYIDNGNIEYTGDVSIGKKNLLIKFKDYNKNDIGNFKFDKGVNNCNLTFIFNYDNKVYNIVISSKYINYTKEGYTNEIDSNIRINYDKINYINGSIKLINNISRTSNINEDASNAVMKSSLSKENLDKVNNYWDNIRNRFER